MNAPWPSSRPAASAKGKLIRLIKAIENGATSFEEVAAVTGIGDGPCEGKRCGEKVRELLEHKRDLPTISRAMRNIEERKLKSHILEKQLETYLEQLDK